MKKKVITKTLSIILSLVMVITGLPLIDIDFITTTNAKTISEYNVGDIIEFGSYPQTKVTDEKLLDELNKLNLNWISYGYYIKRQKSDYMMYADVNYNGIKYRAVKFSQYRPVATVTYTTSRQEYNSLDINTTYWFKYEPLQWRVLDPDEGFLLCEKIIDSQAFNDTNTDDDYLISSIRDWINKEFYDTAFTAVEKSKIQASHYDGDANYDKIFLLSYDEVINSDYGFSSKASNKGSIRSVFGTDYAKVQGLYVVNSTASGKTYVGRSNWWLRSPSSISVQVSAVNHDGTIDTAYIHSTDVGIRPALKTNPNTDLEKLKLNEQIITGKKTGGSTDNKIKIDDVWYEYDASIVGLKETINKFSVGTTITCKLRFGKIVACSQKEINSYATMSIKMPNNTIQYDATTQKYNPENISLSINITNAVRSSSKGNINSDYIAGYDITFDKIVISADNGDMLYFKDGLLNLGKTQEFEKKFDTPITLKAGESFNFNDGLTAYIKDYKWGETELEKGAQISAVAYNGDDVVASVAQNITFKNNTAENTVKKDKETDSECQKAANILDNTKLIISNDFLSDVFTTEQLKSIQNALQCKIALCAMPESTYKKAGIEDKLIEKLMKKAGVSKEWLGTAYRADVCLTVNVDTEKYGQLKVDFNMPVDYYSFGADNPYGGINFGFSYEIKVVKKGKNEIPYDKLSGSGISLGTYANMSNFSDSVQKIALAQLESAYNLGYGNDLNKVGDMLFGETFTKILSKTSAKSYSHLTFSMMTLPAKKAIIRCPVDVYVYDTDGNLCASVENNEITMACEDIDIEVVGDEKYLTIYEGDYSLEIVATANDEMNITIEEYSNSDEKIRTISYNDIKLTIGDSFKTDVDETYFEDEYEIIKNEEENISSDSDESHLHYIVPVKVIDKEPICGESGNYHIECATCGETVSTGIIPTTGHNSVNGICTLCGERAITLEAMSSQIRFSRNDDGSYAGTFDIRTRAMISDEDFTELVGATNEEAVKNIEKVGFVYTVNGENFSATSAQAVAQGEKVAGYVDAPVSYIQEADGYYMFTCLVTGIPAMDKNCTLTAYAYICVNGKWYFSEAPMNADFNSLYETYYPVACEKYGW